MGGEGERREGERGEEERGEGERGGRWSPISALAAMAWLSRYSGEDSQASRTSREDMNTKNPRCICPS